MSGIAPPVHPVNARTLMDSFNYIRLLATQSGAVWQQVDVDNSNTVSEVEFSSVFYIHSGSRVLTMLADRS